MVDVSDYVGSLLVVVGIVIYNLYYINITIIHLELSFDKTMEKASMFIPECVFGCFS